MTKANAGNIVVPAGTKPVHGLDLWEVIVIQSRFGQPVVEAFRQMAEDSGMPQEKVDEIARNYQGVLDKEAWALANKSANVCALEDPLWGAIYKDGKKQYTPKFDGILYQDALDTMSSIVRAEEDFCIVTSGESPWIADGIRHTAPELADRISGVYSGNKKKPETFQKVAQEVQRKGGMLVSHTEDDLGVMLAARDSGVYAPVGLVFVDRDNNKSSAEVEAGGIRYTRDLKDIDYTSWFQGSKEPKTPLKQ